MTDIPHWKRYGNDLYRIFFTSLRDLEAEARQYTDKPKASNAPTGLLGYFRKRFKPTTAEELRQQANDARNLETLSEDEFLKS